TRGPEGARLRWHPAHADERGGQVSYYIMGKDNITFHSQIWPAELLGYAGKGDKGGEPGIYGELNLPTEVVSSEFLTFGDQAFSTSRGNVVYVRQVLDLYGPDGIRYYICAAELGRASCRESDTG